MQQVAKREAQRRKKAQKWVLDSVSYWSGKVDESDIGCDWDSADIRCWRCGYLRSCQRCHIVPRSLGGSDDVSNIIPLCADCHDEMPNVLDPLEVWRWIKADHGIMLDSYWFLRAAQQAGVSIEMLSAKKFAESLRLCGLHFGQLSGRARLNVATIAWAIRRSAIQQVGD